MKVPKVLMPTKPRSSTTRKAPRGTVKQHAIDVLGLDRQREEREIEPHRVALLGALRSDVDHLAQGPRDGEMDLAVLRAVEVEQRIRADVPDQEAVGITLLAGERIEGQPDALVVDLDVGRELAIAEVVLEQDSPDDPRRNPRRGQDVDELERAATGGDLAVVEHPDGAVALQFVDAPDQGAGEAHDVGGLERAPSRAALRSPSRGLPRAPADGGSRGTRPCAA